MSLRFRQVIAQKIAASAVVSRFLSFFTRMSEKNSRNIMREFQLKKAENSMFSRVRKPGIRDFALLIPAWDGDGFASDCVRHQRFQ
jgi:hypothetical protein